MRDARWLIIAICAVVGCGRSSFDVLGKDAGEDARVDDSMPDGEVTGCPPDALLCEDFEGVVDRWGTSLNPIGSSVVTTSTDPHRGAMALEAIVPPSASNGWAEFVLQVPWATQPPALGVRLWVRPIDALRNFAHVLAFTEGATAYLSFSADQNGTWGVSEASLLGGNDYSSSVVNTPGVWTCLEMVLTTSPSRVQFWIDDVMQFEQPLSDPDPDWEVLIVGLARADAVGAHAAVDDLVIADHKVGCGT